MVLLLLLCPCVLHPSKGEVFHVPLPFSSNPHFEARQRQPALSCLETQDPFVTLIINVQRSVLTQETGELFECTKTLQSKLYFKTKHLKAPEQGV